MKGRWLAEIVCLGLGALTLRVPEAEARRSEITDLTPDFEHFQIILDRMPFGRPPPPAAMAPPAAASQALAEQALARQINMSCINITPNGATAIGFTDLAAKPPVNYYLLAGTSSGGWTVIDADYELEVAIIEKDGVRINLKLGKGPLDNAALQTLIAKADGTTSTLTEPVDPKENLLAKRRMEPVFKSATEQLMGMIASAPPGTAPPPLPISDNDDLAEDTRHAFTNQIVIYDDDDAQTVTHKENVAWIKDDMRKSLEKEGGTGSSYLKRLYERQKEIEQKRNAETEKLRHLAETAAKEKVEAEFKAINERLAAEGIPAIEPDGFIEPAETIEPTEPK